MPFVEDKHPTWRGELARAALGVFPLSLTGEINAHDVAHFVHLAAGRMYLRSQSGQTYLCGNGAPRLFNGAMPGSLLHRRKGYEAYVEGPSGV